MPQLAISAESGAREDPVTSVPNQLERIFAAHHGLVFRTAYRITGNAADAEDVLQTVFLRLAGRGAISAPLENPEGYLRRAAVNGALDVVRARQLSAGVPLDDLPSASSPDHREMRAELRKALAQLTPRAAEIFSLRFFEGCSNREIARALGISQVLTAVTLHRARHQLQKAMRPYVGGKS